MRKIAGVLLDLLLVGIAIGLLYFGNSSQFNLDVNDLTRYLCYGTAFWQGGDAIKHIPDYESKCRFFLKGEAASGQQPLTEEQMKQGPFHIMPLEYPLLTVVIFAPPLLVPPEYYGPAFSIWVSLSLILLYFILKKATTRLHGVLFLILMVIAGWGTAFARFDIYPGALTLFALLAAERKRWYTAYIFLAFATMIKLYPVLFILPLFIAQQKGIGGAWIQFKRIKALLVYSAICVALLGISLLINVEGTLHVFLYFGKRPLQIESIPASILWMSRFIGNTIYYPVTYGSVNITGHFGGLIGMASTAATVIGILYVAWLQLRNKINLATSFSLILFVMIATGKVFSPQYLLWLLPILVYAQRQERSWFLPWLLIAILTSVIYPNLYSLGPWEAISATALARNLIMVTILLVQLYNATFAKPEIPPARIEEIPGEVITTDTQEELFVVESKV